MPEEESQIPNPSRRKFLKLALLVAGLAVISPQDLLSLGRGQVPENLRKELLSDRELTEKHIKIYQAPKTKLYLRRSALQFPLLRDAGERKLDEVVIFLVDHHSLNHHNPQVWDSLPNEVKLMWGGFMTEDGKKKEVEEARKYFEAKVENDQSILERFQDRTGLPEDFQKALDTLPEALKRSRRLLKMLEENPQEALKIINETDRTLLGVTLSGRLLPRQFLIEHPEFASKVMVGLAVGGKAGPRPEQSYPNQIFPLPKIPGYTIRHELAHYNAETQLVHSEEEADKILLEGILEASEKFRQNGDSSGYPFVFVNRQGVTITKKIDNRREIGSV